MPVLLFIAFVIVPLIELAIVIEVGNLIGLGPTIFALVLDSLFGAWLVRREGRKVWATITSTFAAPSGSPVDDLTQGALVVFGGALLLTPGFMTDILGLACVLPLTRPAMSSFVRRMASAVTARRMGAGRAGTFGAFVGSGRRTRTQRQDGGDSHGTTSGNPTRRPVRGRPTTPDADGPVDSPDADGPDATRSNATAGTPDVEVLNVERADEDEAVS